MCAQKYPEQRSTTSRIEGLLTWLGGGHWRELGERMRGPRTPSRALLWPSEPCWPGSSPGWR